MAAKFIAFYTQPADPDAFDKRYLGEHLDLARKLPGLQKMEIVKFKKNLMGGELPYYLKAELTFESNDALKAALGSPEGQAAGKDVMGFAGEYVTMVTAEVVQCEELARV